MLSSYLASAGKPVRRLVCCVQLVVCTLPYRQLGSQLHELHPVLPLFDGVTGRAVPQQVDNRVERLRDALMDDARERVDDLGEDLVVGGAQPQL